MIYDNDNVLNKPLILFDIQNSYIQVYKLKEEQHKAKLILNSDLNVYEPFIDSL